LDPGLLESVLQELHDAALRYDVIILDLGAGIDRAVRRMAVFADTLLVVATEEPTSLTDAYAVLKVHTSDSKGAGRSNARIVMNQATSRASGNRIYATLARACQTFLGHAPPLAGVIRRDDKVRDAIRRQALLLSRHPNSVAASDVETVADGLGL
jgi:flagellar biosynthesis protein FlhG